MRQSLILIILFLVFGCGSPDETVVLRFSAQFEDITLDCGSEPIALTDLRFYVSELALLPATGESVAVDFLEQDTRQNDTVALVDLETGQGACQNGTAEQNHEVSGTVPPGDYVGVRFVVGVPFELNHANPLLADAPLDDSAMHWHWRAGYKFLRAGLETTDGSTYIHLGSTGCSGTIGDIEGCSKPNRVAVQLDNFDLARDEVVVDLSALFDAAHRSTGGTTSACQSGPAEAACLPMFEALGLPWGDGAAPKQVVFKSSH